MRYDNALKKVQQKEGCMLQSKKTVPSNISVKALIAEHRINCDDPDCPSKARRLAIKDRLLRLAISDPLSDAASYAAERGWCLQTAA